MQVLHADNVLQLEADAQSRVRQSSYPGLSLLVRKIRVGKLQWSQGTLANRLQRQEAELPGLRLRDLQELLRISDNCREERP